MSDLLVQLCQRIGRAVPAWNQGRGGNVSEKSVDSAGRAVLRIKASGFRLDDVTETAGIATVDLGATESGLTALVARHAGGALDGEVEQQYASLLSGNGAQSKPRYQPSMETGFHVVLPRKYVIHFHSLAAVCLASLRQRDPSRWDRWLQGATPLKCSFLAAIRPGFLLTEPVRAQASADAIILENHGVILHGDSLAILDSWAAFEQAFWAETACPPALRAAMEPTPRGADAARDFLAGKAVPFKLLYPDMAVFSAKVHAVVSPAKSEEHGLYKLLPDAFARDRDAAEMWLAHAALCLLVPDLSPLPEGIASSVGALPTEALRKNIKDSGRA
jgi:ribulose-5-phosphate 4-epimerase/fuculose-1-phosphate aldolase